MFQPLKQLDALDRSLFRLLRREVEALSALSIGGKLKPAQARDLVAFCKLIPELRKEHKALQKIKDEGKEAARKALSDEQLLQEANKTNP